MKTYKNLLIYLLLLVLPLAGIRAQDVISVNDLAKIMRKPDVAIISARKTADYEKVHIMGAVNITYASLNGDMAMLLPPDEIARKLGAKGISETKTIVVYDNGNVTHAARVYWTLKYLGADNVRILNGGMPAWKAGRKPVTRTVPDVRPATFKVNLHPEYLATMAEVQKAVNSNAYVIVDARSNGEYDGTREDPSLKRTGHIPNAVHINYVDLLNDNGELKPKEELAAIFAEHGVTKDKTVISYCKSSVRAGVIFWALSSALDYPNVKVYDGAFLEWQSNPGNKVAH